MSASPARASTIGALPAPSELRDLAAASYDDPVLSIYARTDPRDAPNASPPYAWEIELRNSLRDIAAAVEDDRAARERFAALHRRVEQDIANLDGTHRGRSFVWLLTGDGDDILRIEGLQIPVNRTVAVLDDRPYLAPLADLVDRATPTGVILVGSEDLRLVEWRNGRLDLSEPLVFELELGDWREYRSAAHANPARGQTSVSHSEHYDARVDKQRSKLFERGAHAAAERAHELGWQRVVIVGEGQRLAEFRHALPTALATRVVDAIDHNTSHDGAADLDSLLGPRLEREWLGRTSKLVSEIHEHARAGGAGALGADEVLGALAEGRVAHLVVDPAHDFAGAHSAFEHAGIEVPTGLYAERAIEAAIATGAQVTAVLESDCPALAEAGGMAALLRY